MKSPRRPAVFSDSNCRPDLVVSRKAYVCCLPRNFPGYHRHRGFGLTISIFFLNGLLLLSTVITTTQVDFQAPRFRTGHYEGRAYNTTARQQGKVILDLYGLDPGSHAVRAYFAASAGLSGDAWLTGTIDDRGDLALSGRLLDFAMQLHGHLAPSGTITASYSLTGTTSQEGTFEVRFEHPLTAAVATDLIGAWEIGGGLPAQTNPITGEASGISFVEARRLEISLKAPLSTSKATGIVKEAGCAVVVKSKLFSSKVYCLSITGE